MGLLFWIVPRIRTFSEETPVASLLLNKKILNKSRQIVGTEMFPKIPRL